MSILQTQRVENNLKKLEALVAGKKSALILIYSNPDPDGLASGWALKELLQKYQVQGSIQYTGQVGRLQNATMIQSLRLPATPFDETKLKDAEILATVDAQPAFFKDLDLPHFDIVFDHHPKQTDNGGLIDIRTQCLATSSILTEYLIHAEVPVSRRLATALYYGIQTDSFGQMHRPSETDKIALAFLENKADKNLLSRIEFSQYSLNDLDYFSIALVKHRYARNILYAHIGPVPYTDVCVQVADFLIRVNEAHWALVTAVVENKLVVVFRCDGQKRNAGKVASKAFGSMGSAGGHKTMGRAEIDSAYLPADVSLTSNEKIEWFVANALVKADKSFGSLVRLLRKEGISQKSGEDMLEK